MCKAQARRAVSHDPPTPDAETRCMRGYDSLGTDLAFSLPENQNPHTFKESTMRKLVVFLAALAIGLTFVNTAEAGRRARCRRTRCDRVFRPVVRYVRASERGACCMFDPRTGMHYCRQDTQNGCTLCWGPGTECTWQRALSCEQACPVR